MPPASKSHSDSKLSHYTDPWGDNGTKSQRGFGSVNQQMEELKRLLNFKAPKNTAILVIAGVIILWLLSGLFIVNPEEEAVMLIFGKYHKTSGSGLHYSPPAPIGKVYKLKVTNVNREEIGYSSQVKQEGVILTGDENIVNVDFEVQWKISNAYNYLFNVAEFRSGFTVKEAAESAIREVIGRSTIAFAMEGEGRAKIALQTRQILQSTLDAYGIGIEVVSIQLKKVDPPEKVISAFRDVQSARADKERLINEAQAYRNDIIPRARGESTRIIQNAEGYEGEIVNDAQGQAERFLFILTQYNLNKDITKVRMYLETMEFAIKDVEKVIVTNKINYLNFLNGGAK